MSKSAATYSLPDSSNIENCAPTPKACKLNNGKKKSVCKNVTEKLKLHKVTGRLLAYVCVQVCHFYEASRSKAELNLTRCTLLYRAPTSGQASMKASAMKPSMSFSLITSSFRMVLKHKSNAKNCCIGGTSKFRCSYLRQSANSSGSSQVFPHTTTGLNTTSCSQAKLNEQHQHRKQWAVSWFFNRRNNTYVCTTTM